MLDVEHSNSNRRTSNVELPTSDETPADVRMMSVSTSGSEPSMAAKRPPSVVSIFCLLVLVTIATGWLSSYRFSHYFGLAISPHREVRLESERGRIGLVLDSYVPPLLEGDPAFQWNVQWLESGYDSHHLPWFEPARVSTNAFGFGATHQIDVSYPSAAVVGLLIFGWNEYHRYRKRKRSLASGFAVQATRKRAN